MTPRVSVVIATYERPKTLARALAALRAQSLPDDAFEIIVVDDGSSPPTAAVLEEAAAAEGPLLRTFRCDDNRGASHARNLGLRMAQGELVAFTDDDCVPSPHWLAAGLEAWAGAPDRFVQGPTRPDRRRIGDYGPFSHTLTVETLGPWWETANMFYPRAALEAAGGFDEEAFPRYGEDTDLGWRLMARGWQPVWAADAVVYHDVTRLGPWPKLRMAWRWDGAMLAFRRHPSLRRHLTAKLFWSPNHWWLVRAAVALALPPRLWWLRWWLAAPYVLRLGTLRPEVAGYLVLHDLVEMAACARGGLRFRVPVL